MFKVAQKFASVKSNKSHFANSKMNFFHKPEQAIVDEMIQGPHHKGRVQFQGSWWPARCDFEVVLVPGQVVRVVGIDRITLVVEPLWGQV
jgi:membrane protein implicated in regulation of membrane protease activity